MPPGSKEKRSRNWRQCPARQGRLGVGSLRRRGLAASWVLRGIALSGRMAHPVRWSLGSVSGKDLQIFMAGLDPGQDLKFEIGVSHNSTIYSSEPVSFVNWE